MRRVSQNKPWGLTLVIVAHGYIFPAYVGLTLDRNCLKVESLSYLPIRIARISVILKPVHYQSSLKQLLYLHSAFNLWKRMGVLMVVGEDKAV